MPKLNKLPFISIFILLTFLLPIKNSIADQESVKIALLGGLTGALNQTATELINASKLALYHVNNQGGLFKQGIKLEAIVADSACNVDQSVAVTREIIEKHSIAGIIGPHCSSALIAVANTITIPKKIPTITPTATASIITDLKDNGLVFRTVPSDSFQAQALARVILNRNINNVAVTYVDNDYGNGLAQAFVEEFKSYDGKILKLIAHKENQSSYENTLEQLASGTDTLVIFAYANSSGTDVVRQALQTRYFSTFFGSDAMRNKSIINNLGAINLRNFYASYPNENTRKQYYILENEFDNQGHKLTLPYSANSYDAAFILALAIEKAGNSSQKSISNAIHSIATAPGIKIYPGQWIKAKKAISLNEEIDYVGVANDYEFNFDGDINGNYSLYKVTVEGFKIDVETLR